LLKGQAVIFDHLQGRKTKVFAGNRKSLVAEYACDLAPLPPFAARLPYGKCL
jgi:hypothetical protein